MGMPVALGNGVKVDKGSASRKSDSHRIRSLIISVPVLMKKTADWRAVCGKTARTVRREGRAKPVPTPIIPWREKEYCYLDRRERSRAFGISLSRQKISRAAKNDRS
uniref:Uncharacterized protein n=1 Tax=Candidatus Kentrum sp. LPFa TaxID=2126335 RepID=A0A450XWK4_9GAMM|nr:MAG: hypothetical protein BECKLPF1236C_GA0070990_102161 [Candidatus Kentron sp. LPFa]